MRKNQLVLIENASVRRGPASPASPAGPADLAGRSPRSTRTARAARAARLERATPTERVEADFFRLDDRTRELGRLGVAAAREALRQAGGAAA